jgi:hypothetical protein
LRGLLIVRRHQWWSARRQHDGGRGAKTEWPRCHYAR